MQQQLLAQFPSANLRVYAVWLPMLPGDNRDQWDGTEMPDSRVRHFWNGNRAVGQWFAAHMEGYQGVAWDAYYLYGPAVVWESTPPPLAGSGSAIVAEYDTLERQVQTLLGK